MARTDDPPTTSLPGSDAVFRLETLGVARLTASDGVPVLGPGLPLAVLTYLHAAPGRSARRERLADTFWGTSPTPRGRQSLRQTLTRLRQTLGEDAFTDREGILTLRTPVVSDRDAFLEAMRDGHYADAVRHYGGDFFPDFSSPGSSEFEDWAHNHRIELRDLFSRAAEFVARETLERGDHRAALCLARRLREELPDVELGWRLVIEALLRAGATVSARVEADALERVLERDGRRPEPSTLELLRIARSEMLRSPAEEKQPLLIAQLTGREREFRRLLQVWQSARAGQPAHVHISAPAGLGKTRLLDELRLRLELEGARVAVLRASPGDRGLDYAVAGELAALLCALPGALGIAPGHAAALVAFRPELEARFPGVHPTSPTAGTELLRQRADATGAVLLALAEERPLALLVDDTHWMDETSGRILDALAGHLKQAPVLLVTAGRPDPLRPDGMASAESLVLEPLTVEQVEAMLDSLAAFPDTTTSASVADALAEGSGGSPLLALEGVRHSLERGHLAIREGEWTSDDWQRAVEVLRQAGTLQARLAGLRPDHRTVLTCLALAGGGLTSEQVARTTGITSSPEVLGYLERRGHVQLDGELWRTANERVDEAVLAEADISMVRKCHLGLGRLLASGARPSDTRYLKAARHLAAGGAASEAAELFRRWVSHLRDEGDRRGATALAVEFLGQDALIDPRTIAQGLPLRDRFWVDLRRGIAAAVLIMVVAGSLAFGFHALGEGGPQAEAALIVPIRRSDDEFTLHRVPVRAGRFDPSDTLRPDIGTVEGRWRGVQRMYGGSAVVSPDGRRIAFTKAVGDSGVVDLFLREPDGTVRRLTHARLDDIDPYWSPDGRFLAFATARWSPRDDHDFDLAILDLRSGAVRRLTSFPSLDDRAPVWSPDGTRLAFRRTDVKEQEYVCWITFDGAVERCQGPMRGMETFVIGWRGPGHVVRESRKPGATLLIELDVETGQETRLDSLPEGARTWISPGGAWAICDCKVPGATQSGRHLFRLGDPVRRWQPVHAPDHAGMPFWDPQGAPDAPTGVKIETGGAAMVGVTHLLEAVGIGERGQAIALPKPVLRWSVGDTGMAAIDPGSGLLEPRRPGQVWVRVSAGGWLMDSTLVEFLPLMAATVQQEAWGDGWADRWIGFGEPLPTVVTDQDGRAFWNRGDETFESGAMSRLGHGARAGLGVDALVRTPVTRTVWQRLRLGLSSGARPTDNGLIGREGCTFRFPAGEGLRAGSVYTMTMGLAVPEEPIPDWMRERWYRVRLQLFPDGTCGLAVDGVPIWRSEERLPLAGLYAVHSYGQSVGTRMLVGPLEVWTGVRNDVDWSVLDSALIRRVAERK